MRRRRLPSYSVERRPIHQVDVKPPIVVVVKKAHTGAFGFDDDSLFRRTGDIPPFGEPRLFRYIVEDDWPRLDEAASSDRPVLAVEHRGLRTGIRHLSARRLLLLRCEQNCSTAQRENSESASR